MAIPEYNYIPTYIKRTIDNKPKDVVTASYWNELFNLLITQGDHTAKELGNILNHFSTGLAGIENEIAESAEDIANIHGVFRINVTYSNGVYTADKTFDEIKAAYDAGQLPYVVSGSNTIYTLTDCYLATEQMAMDFKRYLIGDDTLEDDTLRIYSYTTGNGSNIVRQNTEFNIPIKVLEVTLTTQNSVTVADKTFTQVETAVEDGIPVLKVHSDGALLWFFLLDKSPTEIDFVGLADEQIIAYLTAKQDGTWETTVAARVTAEMLSSLSDKLGNLGQLTTTDKTNLVAAVNEVKQTADGKQDKLIAGENITIAADGKTISATGGGGGSTSIAMRVDGGYIQYSTDNGKTWVNLIAEADLKGDKGDKGDPGAPGKDGAPGVYYGTTQPTGDTHPVWIDPDGDHDDGGLLPAVTAADNGKVLRVVSGAWGPADMPTGGADMGITGATVGQIAKITAVDGTGKPTAWEAADMPSGGGDGGAGAKEFRLVRSITLEEQSDRVDISVDSSGNAFALHEVYVMIAAQSYGNAENVNFLPNGRWGTEDAYITSSNKSSSSTDTWRNNMAFHSVYADGIICSEQLPAKGQSNSLMSRFATNQTIITKVSLVSKFAAGCTFLVIGR